MLQSFHRLTKHLLTFEPKRTHHHDFSLEMLPHLTKKREKDMMVVLKFFKLDFVVSRSSVVVLGLDPTGIFN